MAEQTFETKTQAATFRFSVDGEPFNTHEHVLTPRQIMTLAHIDPMTYFLTEIRGHEQVSFEGRTDEPIHMHDHLVFISSSLGPTPVS